jgi:KUP system potassium uptake protein
MGPKQFRMYRCIVRYGYRDVHKDDIEFEGDLVCSIAEFIRSEAATAVTAAAETNREEEDERMSVVGTCSTYMQGIEDQDDDPDKPGTSEIRSPKPLKKKKSKVKKKVRFVVPETPKIEKETREELMELAEAREGGVAYIMGNAYMKAKHGSGLVKRVAINVGYEFLRRNTRGPRTALTSPHASTLEVGMIYHV